MSVKAAGAESVAFVGPRSVTPGALLLPTNAVLAGIAPVARQDLVQMITTNELARFGLNLNTNKDANTLSEKWEGLGLMPLGDAAATNDYLLLFLNDNDFVATNIYQNGVFVGTNALTIDNMFLAYRVTLPGYGAAAPANTAPGVTLNGPTNATLSAPAAFTLTAAGYDQDGVITNAVFYEGVVKIGEDSTFPFQLPLAGVAEGTHTYTVVVSDNSGATASAPRVVVVTSNNLPPVVTLLTPTNNFTANQPVNIAFTASASDPDGSITKVEYYRDATKLGQATTAPYSFTASNFVVGTNLVHALAHDNQGATTASAEATVIVRDLTAPVIVCSSNILLSCTNSAGTIATFNVIATDNNDPNVTVVCMPPSGSLFPVGTNTVNCTATDAAGNSSACDFKVIVLPSLVSIERAVIVRWNCGEVLQGAENINGPWTDIPAATSPYVAPASEARRFYRVRN